MFTTAIKSKFAIITCDEVDNHDWDDDVLAVLPIDDIKKYQFNKPLSRDFHRNYDRLLHFKVKDELVDEVESKLDSISDLVSKAIEDANISHEEYQFILKEIEHYRKMKEEVRTKSKKVADNITSEQREEILKQDREEEKQAFLAKIAASSVTQPVSAT